MVNIYLSIDTEFSIGGAFAHPELNTPVGEQAVQCRVGGKSHGLGFILKTLRAYELQATFFLEAINTDYFGDQPFKIIAEEIIYHQQDLQLHIHPCWSFFNSKDWKSRLQSIHPSDSMAGRSLSDLEKLIGNGLHAFERAGLSKPIALRTGNLQVDRNVYRAMLNLGIPIASNIGCAIQKPEDTSLQLYSGCHDIEGVLEIPVLTYLDLKIAAYRHEKNATIIGSTWREMQKLLWLAKEKSMRSVVILSHPSEFVTVNNLQYTDIAPNYVTQERLEKLCQFVNANDQYFSMKTFSQGREIWEKSSGEKPQELRLPNYLAVQKLLTSKVRAARNSFAKG